MKHLKKITNRVLLNNYAMLMDKLDIQSPFGKDYFCQLILLFSLLG